MGHYFNNNSVGDDRPSNLFLHNSLSILTGPLRSIDGLNIFPLRQGTLVGSEPLLRELVDTLISRRSTSLDHIKDAALIWGKSSDLTCN